MSLYICGIGTATPEVSMTQEKAAEMAKTFIYDDVATQRALPKLYRMTRVKTRSSILLKTNSAGLPEQDFYYPARCATDRGPTTAARMQHFVREAFAIAVVSCRQALAAAGTYPREVTHIITVSCTGFAAPGLDIQLIGELGLPETIQRTHVGFMGCHGALNGLQVAKAIVEGGPQACVLMCCTELCSLHYYYGVDAEKLVANALFADGSAAIVGRAAPGPAGGKGHWRVEACGSLVMPDSQEEMTWIIGDHGFEMTLSASVPSLIAERLKPWMQGWLAGIGFSLTDIRSWAIHPGGPRIVQSTAGCLGLPRSVLRASLETLSEHGNMSSATVLFVIDRLQQDHARTPCVAMAFGPGLAIEACLLL
ncbi:MAG: type III polyketide synthase [Planctomycetes bacterium]|nr:type III polyketide synthase [Planctomycetota bacterium]